MKTKEERSEIMTGSETVNKEFAELSEEELEQVAGGMTVKAGVGSVPRTNSRQVYKPIVPQGSADLPGSEAGSGPVMVQNTGTDSTQTDIAAGLISTPGVLDERFERTIPDINVLGIEFGPDAGYDSNLTPTPVGISMKTLYDGL